MPISNGCNNACTYCVVPYTRGPLVCREPKQIIEEVKTAVHPIRKQSSNGVKEGYKEIWLLGQNVNDYYFKFKTQKASEAKLEKKSFSSTSKVINFAKLFEMVEAIPGNFRLYFISPNPKDFTKELVDVLANSKKFGKCLNLPMQSGDNEILKKMNRRYTAEQYKKLAKEIKKKIPDIYLSTDIIVGFPRETKKQFENTKKLFKEIGFNQAYIGKYSPRPGTAAAKLKDNVPLEEKKEEKKIKRTS